MSATREQLLAKAKKCGEEAKFDDMVDCIFNMIKQNPRLTLEERDIFYIAYKNAVGQRREILRQAPDAAKEREVINLCSEVLEVLENYLIKEAATSDDKVFYYKIKGDYHRYIVEANKSQAHQDKALDSYIMASDYARSLPATSPLRLNVALNYGVLLYEILGDRQRGLSVTKVAVEDASPSAVEALPEQEKKETIFVLSLLSDNIRLWEKEMASR
eukprot:NODE_345_length_1753_cov_511.364437_g280_i0.p2 GENE.NODE_345_length_1753_cov_511.364437_g280_i0~~NODE_345_length_1753_cov_511.364437_g280_i0.p2  ORF type:complete len:216 (-),score=34.84 NODE_345_length_1753_cov_511.364437_g280_i0:1008-1655(-)